MTENYTLHYLEERLASSRPFGDAEYLDTCTTDLYRARLDMLSAHLPEARALLESLLGASQAAQIDVLRDPVVRNSINDALVYFRLDKTLPPGVSVREWATILELARSFIKSSPDGSSPLEAGLERRVHLSGQPNGCVIWCGARGDDVIASKFISLFKSKFPKLRLIEPESEEIALFTAGANLLDEMLPLLGRSALRHVHILAIAGAAHGALPPFTSVTHPNILGTMFLSRSVLKNEWLVAESLLHEALHVKFLDLRHTHSLLCHGYTDEVSKTIRPHWNRPKPGRENVWSVDRSLTVLHVYVCLALFFRKLQQCHEDFLIRFGQRYTSNNPHLSARRSFDRARYLAEELGGCQELGAAGKAFLMWLSKVLDELDPNPAAPGSWTHLLLDRYSRECHEIDYVVASANANRDIEVMEQVAGMLREEAIAAEHITRVMGDPNSATKFSDTVARLDQFPYRDDRPSAMAIRTEVQAALVSAADWGKQDERARVDGLVLDLVERSSERLNTLVARYRPQLRSPVEA